MWRQGKEEAYPPRFTRQTSAAVSAPTPEREGEKAHTLPSCTLVPLKQNCVAPPLPRALLVQTMHLSSGAAYPTNDQTANRHAILEHPLPPHPTPPTQARLLTFSREASSDSFLASAWVTSRRLPSRLPSSSVARAKLRRRIEKGNFQATEKRGKEERQRSPNERHDTFALFCFVFRCVLYCIVLYFCACFVLFCFVFHRAYF